MTSGFELLSDGNEKALRALIHKDSSQVVVQNEEGDTLLHRAAWNGMRQLAKDLLRHGANVNAVNHLGQTPLHLAAKNDQSEIVQLLLKRGAVVDQKDTAGAPPLYYAALGGDSETTKMILAHGSQIDLNSAVLLNMVDNLRSQLDTGVRFADAAFPELLLYHAVFWNYDEVVRLLLKHGIDPNCSWKGDYPLLLATRGRSPNQQIVKALLDAGANPNVRDLTTHKSPINQLRGNSVDKSILQLLIDHGATD